MRFRRVACDSPSTTRSSGGRTGDRLFDVTQLVMPSVGRVRAPDRGAEFAADSVATPDALGWATIALSALLVAAVMASPFSPIGRAFGEPRHLLDYGVHIENAKALTTTGITFPHFLWHALVIAAHTAVPPLS